MAQVLGAQVLPREGTEAQRVSNYFVVATLSFLVQDLLLAIPGDPRRWLTFGDKDERKLKLQKLEGKGEETKVKRKGKVYVMFVLFVLLVVGGSLRRKGSVYLEVTFVEGEGKRDEHGK